MIQQLPTPPFTQESALIKVEAAEGAWNSGDLARLVEALSPECVWRSGPDQFQGRSAIEYFLRQTWMDETHYRLNRELFAYTDTRLSVRFECEWQHRKTGNWFRRHGNEHWEFDIDGYMTRRDMSANDFPISNEERQLNYSIGCPTK